MYLVLLNYIDVTDDIIDIQTVNKEMAIGQANITATQSTVILNNLEGKYDDDKTDSIFYASGWYNRRIIIYDTDIKVSVFNGRIKGYEADDKQAKIIATNYYKDMLDTTCEYTANNKTPAEHIYAIMTTVANIPTANIMYGSYLTAVAEQTSLGIKVNVAISKEHNIDCLQIIQELAKMSCLDIYDNNEIIFMKRWQPYSGASGLVINDLDIIPGTFKQHYNDANLFNDVLLAYSTGSAIAYYNTSDSMSIYNYGITRTFKMPDNSVNSTAIADYKLYYTSQAAAQAAAQIILNRYSYPLKYCEIELSTKYNFLNVNDAIDLYFYYRKEPMQIVKINNKENSIALKCLYLNKPKNYYTIESNYLNEITIMKGFVTGGNTITLLLNDINTNSSYYEIYFRPADGDWTGTDSLQGLSPIIVNRINLKNIRGNYSYSISGLKENTEYQFKIIAYDNANNKSDFSNTYIIKTDNKINYNYENKFNCKGNLAEGITIDVNNSYKGTLPSIVNNDMIKYDSCYYGSNYYAPNSIYETSLFISDKGFEFFSFIIEAGQNKIKWQYRLYDKGNFDEWSELKNSNDAYYFECPPGTKGIQFRFIFYSYTWTDIDVIYLNNYGEA